MSLARLIRFILLVYSFLFVLNIKAANFDVFPSFHAKPNDIIRTLVTPIKTAFFAFTSQAIRRELSNGCIGYEKYEIQLLQCYKEEMGRDINSDQYYLLQEMKITIWNISRTFILKTYNESKEVNKEDILSFKFFGNDEGSYQFIIPERELSLKYQSDDSGFHVYYHNLNQQLKINLVQIDFENRFTQEIETICDQCSLKGVRATALKVDEELYEYFYQRQSISGEALPSDFSNYVIYGIFSPLEKEATRLDPGIPNF